MSFTTVGYINGPSTSAAAVAVAFDASVADPNYLDMSDGTSLVMAANGNGSIVLLTSYWPIGVGIFGSRGSFDSALPFVCGPGTALVLPKREAHALIYLGAARAN